MFMLESVKDKAIKGTFLLHMLYFIKFGNEPNFCVLYKYIG